MIIIAAFFVNLLQVCVILNFFILAHTYNKYIMRQTSVASSKRIERLDSIRSSIKQLSVVSRKTDKIKDQYRRLFLCQSPSSIGFFHSHKQIEDMKKTHLTYINSFLDKYKLIKKIGEGANGCVYKCQHKINRKHYAAKKFKVNQEEIFQLKKHFVYYRQLNCESVIQYKGLYFDDGQKSAYLVMQYFNHPNLNQIRIRDEEELKHITKKIIQALRYLHRKNICHRDIKPDNILYDAKRKSIKIIDFGISKHIFLKGTRRQMLTVIGSTFYLAPQIHLGGGYDQKVDCWSLGVTVYKLITGHTPFQSEYVQEAIDKIKNVKVEFEDKHWKKYNPLARDFVSHLLKFKKKRMNLEEADCHLWFISAKKSKFGRSLSQKQKNPKMIKMIKHACTKEEGMENCQEQFLYFQTKDLDINKTEFDLSEDDFEFYNPSEQQQFEIYKAFTPTVRSEATQFSLAPSYDSLFLI